MLKNKKNILSFIFLNLIWTNTLYAPDWNVSSNQIGPFVNLDNFSLDLGADFNSGDTISSNQMNLKFAEIKSLLENIIRHNNLKYDNESAFKIVYMLDQRKGYDWIGKIGADSLCQNEYVTTTIKNSSETNCSNVQALIGTSALPFENLYPSDSGPFFSHKGVLIAHTWQDFVNLSSINVEDFGGYSGGPGIWIGTNSNQSDSCSDWTSSTGYAAVSNLSSSQIWISGATSSCSSYKSIMCVCD